MELPKSPESAWRIGLILITATAVYLLLYRTSARSLLNKLSPRGRKDSTSKTPPRSISPDKKQPSSTTSPSSYNHALPPSRRESLLELTQSAIPQRDVNEAHIAENILPMTADYRNSPRDLYTPTGFSVNEINALGDFPDYATLSGVPLPNAYPEHEIDKAKPRPYRPFRWNYHQTMCRYSIWSLSRCSILTLSPTSIDKVGYRLVDRARKHVQKSHCPTKRTIRQEWQGGSRRSSGL